MELPISLIPPLYPTEINHPPDDEEAATPAVCPPPCCDDELIVCTHDEEDLTTLTLRELKELCKDRGLNANGKKADLIKRLT